MDHFSELDEYLAGKMSEDYWYDSAIDICEDIIQEFSADDWTKLWNTLPHADKQWNIRLIECLGNIQDSRATKCILRLSNDESKDILIVCIDALRDINLKPELKDIQNLILRAKKLLESGNESELNKGILTAFLGKYETKSDS